MTIERLGSKAKALDTASRFDGLDHVELRDLVFGRCASGGSGSHAFLRKNDLNHFIQDASPKRGLDANTIQSLVENLFDETLELQIDMGSRFHHGIVYDYFQVFLTKVAGLLNMTVMCFLKSLLEW